MNDESEKPAEWALKRPIRVLDLFCCSGGAAAAWGIVVLVVVVVVAGVGASVGAACSCHWLSG